MAKPRPRSPIAALVLSTLPWPAVWLGLYVFHSLVLTFALYHGICLLIPAIAQRRRWIDTVRLPDRRSLIILAVVALVTTPLLAIVYHAIGWVFIDRHAATIALASRGFSARWLIPLGVYFVIVNAAVEEVFWRGVVLDMLTGVRGGVWFAATAFGGWHWLAVRLLVKPGWAELSVGGIVVAGVFFGEVYRRSGSIVSSILWHALVFDLPLIVILATIVRG